MSAKITGTIWDLRLPVPQRMVLLAMVDHADHDGEHIHAPAPFIAWKTGYSERNVYRIIQDLIESGILVVTGASLGEANEYRFDPSRGELKPPYRGRKPKRRVPTPDKMSGGTKATPDKMSGVESRTPDKMSPPPDKMSGGTPDKMAIDHVYTIYRDHDSPPPPAHENPPGGGGVIDPQGPPDGKPGKTELYHWLRSQGVDSPQAAERNQHHDLARTQAMFTRMVGDAIGDERKKRIGRFIRAIEADGPPPLPAPRPPPVAPPPIERPPDLLDRQEAARRMVAHRQAQKRTPP